MEKRDLSFKNFISIFFKNLTFGKITEDDIIDNEINYYKESDTNTYNGGKYNNDILKLKLEIPNTVATQFNDLETKFNKIVKKSNNLIPEIQKQLEEKKNNYLSYGGVDEPNINLSDNLIYGGVDEPNINLSDNLIYGGVDEPKINLSDNSSYLPQQFNNTESFDSQINNDSITQKQTDSDLELDDSDDFDLSNPDISNSNLNSLEEFEKSLNDSSDNEERYNQNNEKSEDKKESVDDEIIKDDDIEKQLIDLYEPLKDKLKKDTKIDLELSKKMVLLSNDLDPYENLFKDYEKSKQKETSKDSKFLFGGIEKINLVDDNDDIINNDKIESEDDNENIDLDNDNENMDTEDNNEIESEKDNYIENVNTENDDEDLMQSSNSIDPEYAKEIITNVIEDQQNENRKIRFGF